MEARNYIKQKLNINNGKSTLETKRLGSMEGIYKNKENNKNTAKQKP